jgi:quinone-modifying oxidoreductase, subunit QmoC
VATVPLIAPSEDFRRELMHRGGERVSRCFQCATCSAVCELAPDERPFPRRQVLLAQWGQGDQLAADSAVWLCHQCNDCTVRCPRDVRPGDLMQVVRAMVIERLAAPAFLGRLVANVNQTWPVLLGAPLLLWVLLLGMTGHLGVPPGFHAYEQLVPHWLIYSVFFPVAAFVIGAAWVGGRRFWTLLGAVGPPRKGSFVANLMPVLGEIATHNRFGSCEAARPRRWGHLALLWGFIGAAATSGLLVVALYGFGAELPLPLDHPFKILGNISAVLLVAGGAVLLVNRLGDPAKSGRSTAFDSFFLTVVLLVIATGVLVEVGRFVFPAALACSLYVVHLGVVLTLFITFPYSKFAHMLYRTLAMVHERMTG